MGPFTRNLAPNTPVKAFSELSTEANSPVGSNRASGLRYAAAKQEGPAFNLTSPKLSSARITPKASLSAPPEDDASGVARAVSPALSRMSEDSDNSDKKSPSAWDGRTVVSKEVKRALKASYLATNRQSRATISDAEKLRMLVEANQIEGESEPWQSEGNAFALPSKAQHITAFFDRHGLLLQQCPRHWALEACSSHPLHKCYQSADNQPVVISRRLQNANAKHSLEIDQWRREAYIRACIEQQCIDNLGQPDQQQQRYMRLLFEPLVDYREVMLKDVVDEPFHGSSNSSSGNDAGKFGLRSRKQSSKWNFARKGTLSLRLVMGSSKPQAIEHTPRPTEVGSAGILTNEQRATLLLIFQRYVFRVSGAVNGGEQMQRSTWFRFLHHCGILGPEGSSGDTPEPTVQKSVMVSPMSRGSLLNPTDLHATMAPAPEQGRRPSKIKDGLDVDRKGGVSWSHASSVFGIYAEACQVGIGAPTLTFSSWVNAVQHILRGPTFYRTQKEVISNLFGVCLQRCEARLSGGSSGAISLAGAWLGCCADKKSIRQSEEGERRFGPGRTPAAAVAPSMRESLRKAVAGRSSRNTGSVFKRSSLWKSAEPSSNPDEPVSQESAGQMREDVGVLGWQSDLAEEQMCEPEVLQMLHEFEGPLQQLFMHYALKDLHAKDEQKGTSAGGNPSPPIAEKKDDGKRRKTIPPKHGRRRSSRKASKPRHSSIPAGFSPHTVVAVEADAAAFNEAEASDQDSDGSTFWSESLQDSDEEMDSTEFADEIQELGSSGGTQNGKRRKSSIESMAMEPENFHYLLHEFGFMPTVVQIHSARQHVEISLTRRNTLLISFECFVEILCRIAFVYMSNFGNSVQQGSPSKAKIVWLITLLRARCRDLKLPQGLADLKGPTWTKKKSFNLDGAELESLVRTSSTCA